MPELLIELLSEEIPARMQVRAADDFAGLLAQRLTAAGLKHESIQAFSTPRRIAAVVKGLPKQQPDVTEERRGPRTDAPQKAIEGFLRANALKSVKQAEVRSLDKGEFYFAVRAIKGQATTAVLPDLIRESVQALGWPKSMRWRDGQFRWVRPLQSVVAVYNGQPLTGGLPLSATRTLEFGNTSEGHRFLAPKPFKVRNFADYQAKLLKAKVILDPAERRAEILRQAKQRIGRARLKLKDDPALLDEVTGLVEWPVVLMGEIDPEFMDLPPEVLTTSMRAHQKYLALLDGKGRLSNRFMLVANMETNDKGKTIVAGNERVLRARLADARFFWDQDRKQTLASRASRLGDIVFHEKLGTLDAKVDRMQALATEIADYVPGAEKDRVRSAARLAKADLVTGMVGEFPELQGIMGRYYALHDGENKDVAQAIAEHYSPLGPGDACPKAPVSVTVALADKIDTMVGFFAMGEKPTGSKDPYALRRTALGIIRLILENRLRLPLMKAFDLASHTAPMAQRSDWRGVAGELLDFFADRLKVALRDKGVRHDLITAVFAVGGEDDFVRLLARVAALEKFLKTDDGANLLVAYRRAANIVKIEEKRDSRAYDGDADPTAMRQEEERELFRALGAAAAAARTAIAAENFKNAMTALAALRGPIDSFFDKVTVNAEERDVRANRLRLLARIRATLDRVADFSKIEG
jgi:glycyl-tRNA synthetase beta chain